MRYPMVEDQAVVADEDAVTRALGAERVGGEGVGGNKRSGYPPPMKGPGPAHSRSRRVLAPQSAHLLLAAQIELAAPGYFIAPRLRWPPSPCTHARGAPQRSALDEHQWSGASSAPRCGMESTRMAPFFAFLHHLAAFTLVAALVVEFVLLKDELTLRSARKILVADMILEHRRRLSIPGRPRPRVPFSRRGHTTIFTIGHSSPNCRCSSLIAIASIVPNQGILSWRSAVS